MECLRGNLHTGYHGEFLRNEPLVGLAMIQPKGEGCIHIPAPRKSGGFLLVHGSNSVWLVDTEGRYSRN